MIRRLIGFVRWIFEPEVLEAPPPAPAASGGDSWWRWLTSREPLEAPPEAVREPEKGPSFFGWLLAGERLEDAPGPKDARNG